MNRADEVDHATAEMDGPEFLARRRRWAASMDVDLQAVAMAITDPVERWAEDAVLARLVAHLGAESEPEHFRVLLRVQVGKLVDAGVITIDVDGFAVINFDRIVQFGQGAPHDFACPLVVAEWL